MEKLEIQLPLPGFKIVQKSPIDGREVTIENMGSGRIRVHAKKGAVAPKKGK